MALRWRRCDGERQRLPSMGKIMRKAAATANNSSHGVNANNSSDGMPNPSSDHSFSSDMSLWFRSSAASRSHFPIRASGQRSVSSRRHSELVGYMTAETKLRIFQPESPPPPGTPMGTEYL